MINDTFIDSFNNRRNQMSKVYPTKNTFLLTLICSLIILSSNPTTKKNEIKANQSYHFHSIFSLKRLKDFCYTMTWHNQPTFFITSCLLSRQFSIPWFFQSVFFLLFCRERSYTIIVTYIHIVKTVVWRKKEREREAENAETFLSPLVLTYMYYMQQIVVTNRIFCVACLFFWPCSWLLKTLNTFYNFFASLYWMEMLFFIVVDLQAC